MRLAGRGKGQSCGGGKCEFEGAPYGRCGTSPLSAIVMAYVQMSPKFSWVHGWGFSKLDWKKGA